MARTSKNNIYYNDDENSIADVLSDMKNLAESVDDAIENSKYDDTDLKQDISTLKTDNEKNKTNITNIEKKSTEQDKSISNNAKSIEELHTENEALKEENRIIKEQIPGAVAIGNNIHLTDSSNLEMNWKIKGGHRQEGEPSLDDPAEIEIVGNNINYINMNNYNEQTSNGITYSIKNNILKIKGTATANNTIIFNSKEFVNLKADKYTLNVNKNGFVTGVFGYYIYGSSESTSSPRKILIDGGNLASASNSGIKTQELTSDYYNCCFGIYFAKDCAVDMTLTPKLEKGTVATPYSPYGIGSVKIDVVNNDNTKSQTIIMPIQQEMLEGDYIADVEHHEWGRIESYNGETITTDYISTTGELTTSATVYYKLAEPINLSLTEAQKAIRENKLYTYKNITNISLDNELASIEVEYKKDLETEHNKLQNEIDEIKQLLSTTQTSALLLDNMQNDIESEVE